MPMIEDQEKICWCFPVFICCPILPHYLSCLLAFPPLLGLENGDDHKDMMYWFGTVVFVRVFVLLHAYHTCMIKRLTVASALQNLFQQLA